MNISVERYSYAWMTKDFAQAFYLKTELDASGCKGVSQHVKIRVWYPAFGQISFEFVLYGSRVGTMFRTFRKNKICRFGTELKKQFRQKRRKRYHPWRCIAFRFCQKQTGFIFAVIRSQSLHGFFYFNWFFLCWDIFPFQSANFSESYPRIQRK